MFLFALFALVLTLNLTHTPVPEWAPAVILAALAVDGAVYKLRKARR